MKNIEVEVRAFITKEQYDALFKRFGNASNEDEQVTYYFNGPVDLRIQQNRSYSKIWLKKGALHSDAREEVEVHVAREDFGKLEALFRALGYEIAIKWFRTRNEFTYDGATVTLDYTKGYGYILELEKIVNAESDVEKTKRELIEKMRSLGITPTPKEEFDRAYAAYKQNWRALVGEHSQAI
ncbi:MAG: CYTH domain-containing protein [Candidatus Aenigmarchaeota archaeon]|nr:CYTH domain-containing protein [Candidatus Aenigmarchaeota archaeon]